jgi:hypothetical protein
MDGAKLEAGSKIHLTEIESITYTSNTNEGDQNMAQIWAG